MIAEDAKIPTKSWWTESNMMEAVTAISTLLLAIATFVLCGITVWVATKDRRPHLIIETSFHEIREGLFSKHVILTVTNDSQIAVTVIAACWKTEGLQLPIYWQKKIPAGVGTHSSSEILKISDIKLMAGDVAHFDLVTNAVSANGAFLNATKHQVVVRLSTGREFSADLPPAVFRNLQT